MKEDNDGAMQELKWLADNGVHFALPIGRSKNKFEMDWPNKPHTIDEAIDHARKGGNVGILTGKHSGGIVAIDRDVDFSQTISLLGELAHTAKIVRSNAPERGKFLFRITGELPATTSWKPQGVKHPECEFLGDSGQRHALCPPSQIDGGQYRLIDTEYGIQELTVIELDYVWRLITGGSIYKEVRAKEEAEADRQAKDEYIRTVKDSWTVTSVFEHFDKAANGTVKEKGQTRLLGNGGLLISTDGSQWYCHADSVGGDMIDALCFCKWKKKLDRGNPKMFWDAVDLLAEIASIEKPKLYVNGTNKTNTNGSKPSPDYAKEEPQAEEPQAIEDKSNFDLDTLFLRQSASDEGNAQCVKALHGDKFLYCGAYEWMKNVETHWQHGEGVAERDLNLSVTQTLISRRVAATKADIEAIIKATKPNATNKENTKRQFKDMVWVAANDFDAEKHLLNCKSGVIDLRSAKLVSHSPSDRFTYCVDAEFNVESSCNVWDGFLSDSVKDYDTIKDWLQMSVGYGVTGYTNEEIMFYLFGPTRSGKGTFTNSMLTMLGKPLAMGVNFSMFTSKRDGDSQNFDLAPLKPARFIAASESGKYNTMNEAVVKQITGNDSIQASFKGKDQFTFFPQFKIWLSSNHPVKGDVDDDAFWGRVKVIEFPNSRLGAEDKSLKERLQSAECRNAILAYAVIGSRMWYNNAAGLVTPTTVKESTANQRLDLDDVRRWLDERTVRTEKANTSNAKIYASYTTWCFANGVEPKHAAMFGRSMKNKGFESVSMREPGFANPTRGYKSIGLVADKLPENSSEL